MLFVCAVINAPDQCWAAAKKPGDERFLGDFLLFSLTHTQHTHTHCYEPNWMIGGGIFPLPGVFGGGGAAVCRFYPPVGNSLKPRKSFIQ